MVILGFVKKLSNKISFAKPMVPWVDLGHHGDLGHSGDLGQPNDLGYPGDLGHKL